MAVNTYYTGDRNIYKAEAFECCPRSAGKKTSLITSDLQDLKTCTPMALCRCFVMPRTLCLYAQLLVPFLEIVSDEAEHI